MTGLDLDDTSSIYHYMIATNEGDWCEVVVDEFEIETQNCPNKITEP